MAVSNMHIHLGANIKGSNNVEKDTCEVAHYNWGVSNSAEAHSSSGGSTGQAYVNSFSFSKPIDTGTSGLLKAVLTGKAIPKVVFKVIRSGDDKPNQDAYILTMEDVRVVSVSRGDSGAMVPSENVTLVFGKFVEEIFQQDATGAMKNAGKQGYNIQANTLI